MKHYAELDISVKEIATCIVDEAGKIRRELKAPSRPEHSVRVPRHPAWRLERIGLQAEFVAMAVQRPGGGRIAGGCRLVYRGV